MQLKNALVLVLSTALVATGAPVQTPEESRVQTLERRVNHDLTWAPIHNEGGQPSPIKRQINETDSSSKPPTLHGDEQPPPLERRVNHDLTWAPIHNEGGSPSPIKRQLNETDSSPKPPTLDKNENERLSPLKRRMNSIGLTWKPPHSS